MTTYQEIILGKVNYGAKKVQEEVALKTESEQLDQYKAWSEEFWTQKFLSDLTSIASLKQIRLSLLMMNGEIDKDTAMLRSMEISTLQHVIKLTTRFGG